MPIPFRDAEEIEELGAAGFLRFIPDFPGKAVFGGVLLVDARAEPIELVHHWMAIPGGSLWSPEDAWRHAGRRLAAELFRALGSTPAFLLILEDPALEPWLRDVKISIPVGLVRGTGDGAAATVRWLSEPSSGSPAARLFERLAGRGLLAEPFQRVARALREFHCAPVPETSD